MIHGNRSHLPWLSEFQKIRMRNPCSPFFAPRSHNSFSRSVEVRIQGSQTNPGETNPDTRNLIKRISTVVTLEQPLRQARISKVFQEVEK
jgi:hypothetical protein